jgi:acetolactate synthase-1/2/3 large subunit
LRRPFAEWGTEGLTIVRIDIDDDEIHRVRAPAIPVLGDAVACMRALLVDLPPMGDRAAWNDQIRAARNDIGAELAKLQPQVGFLEAMRDALPDDGILVDELTQVGYTARITFPVRQPSTYISSTYFGALGFGFATALGVKVAHPEREVLSLSGDGGFLYTANELASAVQHGLGVVAVVFNDSSYANVERSQRRHLSVGIGTALHNPDFPLFAESFGAVGVRVHDADGLQAEIEKGFTRSHTPTLIEVPVGPMPNPWPFIRLPKVR